MKNLHGRSILGLCVVLTLVASSASATNGYFTTGTGTKSKAQAGAGSADPQELMSIATNPAGLAFLPQSIDAGVSIFSPMRDYETSGIPPGYGYPGQCFPGQGCTFTIGPNDLSSANEFFPIPFVGANWALSDQSALALAFYARGGMNTKWEGGTATFDPTGGAGELPLDPFNGTYGNGTAGVDLMQGFLNLTYGWKSAEDRFGLGASAIFAMQRFEARGVMSFAPYTKTYVESYFTTGTPQMPKNLSSNGHDMSYGYGASVGALWNVTDMFSIAAAYTTKMSMGDFGDYADLFAGGGGFDIPSTGTIGITVRPSEAWALSFDVQEIWYSDVDAVSNPIDNLAKCPIMGGSDFESCLGGKKGPGFGWEDMTVYKLGASWKYSDTWTWRAGYSFTDQPIPKDQMTFNILAPGVVEQHFTVGFTQARPGGNEVNLSFMYAPETSVKGENNFDPRQTVELSMSQIELELSYSWKR
jgi:long-chain fatty acid transport protein